MVNSIDSKPCSYMMNIIDYIFEETENFFCQKKNPMMYLDKLCQSLKILVIIIYKYELKEFKFKKEFLIFFQTYKYNE